MGEEEGSYVWFFIFLIDLRPGNNLSSEMPTCMFSQNIYSAKKQKTKHKAKQQNCQFTLIRNKAKLRRDAQM